MNATTSTSLKGKTIRWTFDDGPVAGKTFEHTLNADGSIDWRMAGSKNKPTHEKQAAVVPIGDGAAVVSYRAESGYTLTVVLDFAKKTMVGFGSNSDMWSKQSGTFEIVDAT